MTTATAQQPVHIDQHAPRWSREELREIGVKLCSACNGAGWQSQEPVRGVPRGNPCARCGIYGVVDEASGRGFNWKGGLR